MKNVYLISILSLIMIISACGTMSESGNPLYQAGTYEGSGDGYFGLVSVSVTVTETAITEVEILSHGDTEGIGTIAFEELAQTIIYTNSSDVDVISGATGSSEGFIAAVNDALLHARIE
jgi:urocanate reductase